jgi:hypothetical protein
MIGAGIPDPRLALAMADATELKQSTITPILDSLLNSPSATPAFVIHPLPILMAMGQSEALSPNPGSAVEMGHSLQAVGDLDDFRKLTVIGRDLMLQCIP